MLEKWAASGNKITIYDYYGLYGDFPRPVDRIVQADLLFEEQLKITGVHSEVMQDNERQSCYWCREIPSRQFWDVNSIYIWTATQLLWDPHQDVDKLRSRYLRTVFGAAAPDVAEYLKYTEQVWKENFIPDDFHTNRHAQYYRMAETGMVEKCRLAIARARSREVSGRSRLMMERLFQPFDERAQLFEDFTQAQRFCQERNTDPGKYPNLLEQAKWRFWKRTTGSGGQEKLDRSNKRYRYVKDAGTACFFSDLTLEKNHLYWFSCRIRMENPEIGNAGFTPKFYRMKDKKIIWLDGYSNTFYPPEKSKNRWVEVSGFVRTPEVAEHVRMLMGANRIKGKVWFDAPEVYLIK